MSASSRWADLGPRLGIGFIIAVIGLACVWAGGAVFLILTVLISACMIWELVRMLDRSAPAVPLAVGSGGALLVAGLLPAGYALPLLIAPVFVGFSQMSQHRATYSVFALMIVLAGFGMFILREQFGFAWMLWLALVVMATDIMGYFAGRFIGGPRFWPRVSPKKTWSGTIAGWIGAAIVGAIFVHFTTSTYELVGISVAISMASQLGDIAESAVKRRMGVKDSSNLLPGHGGLFDRFDGMLGGVVFLLLVEQLIDFPPGVVIGL
ncbi:phosphatidate cytidylyltransferase [Palleronia sp. LCG004]|uniref:phosphatidate cytidylyltransferase n=1 Tax=Palleronia sp. LCG004 TaxID=3079304 RepID=UPI0029429F31|nr:phosphatidate cytidylyltransferase [Palleronia sp. LCG004]WOI57013.1 phosphatidate cytidylyltransferase [Palleronia sp. LCG004]